MYPFGVRSGHHHHGITRAAMHQTKQLGFLAAHYVRRILAAPRNTWQHDDMAFCRHPNRSSNNACQPRRQAHIGRFDPAGPRTGHTADHHRQIIGRIDLSQMLFKQRLKTRFFGVQQPVIATAFLEHSAIDIQRPEAKPGRSPVRNCRKWLLNLRHQWLSRGRPRVCAIS